MKNFLKYGITIVVSVIVGGIITFLLFTLTDLFNGLLSKDTNIKTITKNGTQVVEKSSLSTSVDKVIDAVVLINGYRNSTLTNTGTGFIYKVDNKYGYILTNHHVIDSTNSIKVVLNDKTEVDGKVLGSDEYLDLAVVQIDKKYVKSIAELGDSTKSKIGDTVLAIGAPMGETYMNSVTSGIISGINRMVSVSINNSSSEDYVMSVIQTDAAVNPGNSGGPLVNVNGEVIGVISLKLIKEEIEGMGFAIPMEYASSQLDMLEKGKSPEWPVLGVTMNNVNSDYYSSNAAVDYGVEIASIVSGTGAASSGLKAGDIIVAINGEKVENAAYLRYYLYKYKPGETIEVTYYRGNNKGTAKVKLTKQSS